MLSCATAGVSPRHRARGNSPFVPGPWADRTGTPVLPRMSRAVDCDWDAPIRRVTVEEVAMTIPAGWWVVGTGVPPVARTLDGPALPVVVLLVVFAVVMALRAGWRARRDRV